MDVNGDEEEDGGKSKSLKRTRGGYLADVTRKRNDITSLLSDEVNNLEEVNFRMQRFYKSLTSLKEAHQLYNSSLKDDEEIMESNSYFAEVMENIGRFTYKKQSLEQEEAYLKLQEKQLKLKRRNLDLEINLAKASAREKVYAQVEPNNDDVFDAENLQNKTLKASEVKSLTKDKLMRFQDTQDNMGSYLNEQGKLIQDMESFLDNPTGAHATQRRQSRPTKDESIPLRSQATQQSMYSYLDNQGKLIQEMMINQQKISLPKRNMPTFSGDPLEYCAFIRAFETLIEAKEPDSAGRLYYLEQYTSGRAKELVRSCQHMDPNAGYSEARKLLNVKFGQRHKIAMAYVDKVVSGPIIKPEDSDALEGFAIQLISCKNSLKAINYISKIENPECMKRMIQRLPTRLQERWRDVADRIINIQQREVTIEDIARFVEEKGQEH
ncbi:hypothetical protein QZH41_002175 [Actinostola sp. cb2023]|nr:hypothetical protein QZH41_002175 [Actinostola sp. cb2023]